MTKIEKTNGDNKNQRFNTPSEGDNKSNDKKQSSHKTTQGSIKKKQHFFSFAKRFWKITSITDKANITLAVCSIASLVIIYILSNRQIELSKDALKRQDSSNSYTRQSVKIAQDTFSYQRVRDSNNTISQNAKDSAFAKSQHDRDSLNRESFILENRAYLVLNNIGPLRFNFNELGTIMPFTYKNVGKTPAKWITPYTFYTPSEDYIANLVILGEKSLAKHHNDGVILGVGDTISFPLHFGTIPVQDSNILTIKAKIYIGSIVGYTDVFGNIHFTYTCTETLLNSGEAKAYKKYNEIK